MNTHTHDTSGHDKKMASHQPIVGGLKNGPASSNDSMESMPQHHSLRHGEGKYTPTTIDPERASDEDSMNGSPC